MRRTRALAATLAAIAFGAPLAWLLAVPVPAMSRRPLTHPPAVAAAFPVEIPELRYLRIRGGGSVHRVRLATRDVAAFARHAQVSLLVATYDTRASLDRAELAVTGTDCVFRTLPGVPFPNNGLLTFVRGAGCSRVGGADGGLRLTVRFDTPARAAVWADAGTEQDEAAGAIVVSDRSVPETPRRPMLRGALVDIDPSNAMSRARLLAHMWEVSRSAAWIWIAVGASTALVWIAVFLLAGTTDDREEGRRAILRSMAGGFAAASALALAYATLVPPFQSADEPNHFVGFAAFAGRADIDAEAARWARATHFERIQFHPEEHFTPAHVGVEGEPWNDGTVPDPSLRGAAVQWFWRAVPPFVRALPAPRLLLALRVIGVLLFALVIAVFLGIVTAAGEPRHPELLALPLFLVPTLPFFAMTVSNYGPLTAAYVLVAAGIVLDFRDARGAAWAGPLIGGGWMIASLTARSALPLAPFILAWLAGRLVVGRGDRRWRPALIYWMGVTTFLVAGVALADRGYVQTTAGFANKALPGAIANAVMALIARPWVLPAAGLFAAAIERAVSRRRPEAPAALRAVLRRAAIAAPVATILMLAGSLFYRYPRLAFVDPANPPEPAEYVTHAMAAGVTIVRAAHPDFLTSWSFWGGFGWLETVPPPAFVSALAAASGLALAGLIYLLARAGDVRALIRVAFAIAGWAVSLAAYALTVIVATPADLHGRYLLGLYLAMLAIAWSSVSIAARESSVGRTAIVRGACAAACIAVHVVSLGVILTRYF
jgi:hypothetical protein